MYKNTLFFIILFCSSTILQSQTWLSLSVAPKNAPIKWGKVSQEDLKMTVYEENPETDAVVLCDFGQVSIMQSLNGWSQYVTVHRRIKILKESGLRFADIEIPFYSYQRNEILSSIQAQVIQPDSTFQEMDLKDMIEQSIADGGSMCKFSIPNVHVGSIIEYQFTSLSKSVAYLRDWVFQDEIPIRWSELRTFFPPRFGYSYIFQGVGDMATVVKSDTLTIMKGEVGEFSMRTNQFIMKNAIALKEEAYVTTMSDYKAKIRFQLSEYLSYRGKTITFSDTWNKLATELTESEYFGEQYLKKKNHRKVLKETVPLMENLNSETEKAKVAYDYLNRIMEWNESLGFFVKSETLNDAFDEKKVTAAEMNLMLLASLLSQEIEAYPLMTSTRENGRVIDEFPLLDQFDHLMVFAVLDEDEYILDCGNEMRAIGMPRIPALNKKAWIVHPTKSKWIDIIPKRGMDIYTMKLNLADDGSIDGSIKSAHTGYNAMSERLNFQEDETGNYWKEGLENKFPDFQMTNFSANNFDNLKKPFENVFDIKIEDVGLVAGDFIYFSPILFSGFEENIFKLEQRNYPVDIPYPFVEQLNIEAKIPQDYVIEDLPEGSNLVLPNGGGKFRFAIEKKDENTISIIARLDVKQIHFHPEEYPNIKELFDLVVEKYGEQVVLKKKT